MTDSTQPAITVSFPQDKIALLTMDLPGSGANILNEQLFQELDSTMAELSEQDLDGVILYSAKPSIFVAGADLNHIMAHLDDPDKAIVKFCEKGRAVMARFSRCPFVSVAAIHGACVGGGLELALWCDQRVASDHRKTVLGLPEVKLGLVPGWAGTARLPRISGLDVALDLVTSGRLVNGPTALEMKFVDALVEQEQLLDRAIRMVQESKRSESFVSNRRTIMGAAVGLPLDDPEAAHGIVSAAANEYGERIVNNSEIYPYAPMVALEHLTRTATLGMKPAWDSESIAMAQVWGSPASRGLLNHFFLTDRNKKNPGIVDLSLSTPPIESVGIVGAGLMGKSIAETCLKRGLSITLLDADEALAQAVARELGQATPTSIQATNDYGDFAAASLVIESVVESQSVKAIVLERIEAAVGQETLIASNTSAIPIESLAKPLQHPSRFCGIHFCHPELMSLVEVVCGPETAEATIASSVRWIQDLRKMPVAINDSPGFVVNRLLAAMIDQAIRLYCQGVELKAIDEAMVEFGFLGGPFEIMDAIGVDTCMYAGRTMWESKLTCVSLSPILPRLVKAGRLGRKSGAGFYSYDGVGLQERGKLDATLLELIQSYRDDEPVNQHLDAAAMVRQILAAMALEATRILQEEVVDAPQDIDLCVIHGFGFPKHQGGILFWADQQSWQTVKQALYKISIHEPKLDPSPFVIDLANQQKTIYENS